MRAAAFFAVVLGLAPGARAERPVELGGFLGGHMFSQELELGVFEESVATSPMNALAGGVRGAIALWRMLDLELELGLVVSEAREGQADVMVIEGRGHALWHFGGERARLRPFVLAGGGVMTSSSSNRSVIDLDTDPVLHAGGGAKYRVGPRWGVRLDLRVMLPPSSDSASVTTDFEGFVGLFGRFGGAAEPPAPIVVAPEPSPSPEPSPAPVDPDPDHDNILGAADQCPEQPETMNQIDDRDGCPDEIPDTDGDGMRDDVDACPTAQEDVDGFEDDDGCVDEDNDKDGVVDTSDACAGSAEQPNGFEDADGCPDELPPDVRAVLGVLPVKFGKNSEVIDKKTFAALDGLVQMLAAHDDVAILVEAHTEDGARDALLDLSARRAEAIKSYLVSKGVKAERVQTRGWGPDKPIADNKTKQGKEQNRRVEVTLIVR